MIADKIKELAEFMHEKYEEHAIKVGWETQKECQTLFKDLPDENKTVMLLLAEDVEKRVCNEIITKLQKGRICVVTYIKDCAFCKKKITKGYQIELIIKKRTKNYHYNCWLEKELEK